jgi:para-nitrobenzyl esterase
MDAALQISSGALRGAVSDSIFSFKGIPFAAPVSGRHRWLPPQAPSAWSEQRDATQFGPIGLQFIGRQLPSFSSSRREYLRFISPRAEQPQGDEQLTVNVWTPTLQANSGLPVMVYIHGGSLLGGGATLPIYDGTNLARRGVVYVSIQYRLGPVGFMHGQGLFGQDFCADNRGFLDQIAALQWVQTNIHRFGGDPACVTVFGESAGAVSVYNLIASPLAKGLFRRAIAMSGSPAAAAPAADHRQLASDALAAHGVKPGDEAALTGLNEASLQKLLGTMRKLGAKRGSSMRLNTISAAVGSAFLPDYPMRTLSSGACNKVDLMLGTCADDGQLISAVVPGPGWLGSSIVLKAFQDMLPGRDMAAALRFYKKNHPSTGPTFIRDQIINDMIFRFSTIRAAELHSKNHIGHTWLYQVDWHSAVDGLRAIHAIDCPLAFDNVAKAGGMLKDDTATNAQARMMADAWVSFARTGVPEASGLPQWPAYDAASRATMVFDRRNRIEHDYGHSFRDYWPSAAEELAALPPINAIHQ